MRGEGVCATGQWRLAGGGVREGGGVGCSGLGQTGVLSEREQSARWGRDIAVSNKQTTDTNTSAARGLFLSAHNEIDCEGDGVQMHTHMRAHTQKSEHMSKKNNETSFKS